MLRRSNGARDKSGWDFYPGAFQSPPLATDPRAVKCSTCGRLMYPGQICDRCPEQAKSKVVHDG